MSATAKAEVTLDCYYCHCQEFKDFAQLADHVWHACTEFPLGDVWRKVRGKKGEISYMRVTERAKDPSLQAAEAPLLHGSDVPKNKQYVDVKIKAVRVLPKDFNAWFIADIEPIFEKESWAINKSNAKALAADHGDDTDDWIGKKVRLYVVLVNNPKTGGLTRSLSAAEPE